MAQHKTHTRAGTLNLLPILAPDLSPELAAQVERERAEHQATFAKRRKAIKTDPADIARRVAYLRVRMVVSVLAVVLLSGCGRRIMGPEVGQTTQAVESETHGEGHSLAQYIVLAQGGECWCDVCGGGE